MLSPELVFAIASRALADPKTVRKWARGGKDRGRMKPSAVTRIERAASELGVRLPTTEARP
jgi:hypothetical protein